MARKVTLVSPDKQWKAEIAAFKHNWFVYKDIGAGAAVYHWQPGHKTWFGRTRGGWKWHTADLISIACTFIGSLPPGSGTYYGSAPSTSRTTAQKNAFFSENKLWAFGPVSISFDMTGATLSNPSPGASAARLEVQSVSAVVRVTIGQLELGDVVEAS